MHLYSGSGCALGNTLASHNGCRLRGSLPHQDRPWKIAIVFLFVVLVYCLFRFLFELFDLCFPSLFLFVLTLVLHLLSVGLNVALARQ